LTWVDCNPPIVTDDGANTFVTYKIALDQYGAPYATVQGYLDPAEDEYTVAEDNFLCYMCNNEDDQFCGQAGWDTVAEAVEAIEFIAREGKTPPGFFSGM